MSKRYPQIIEWNNLLDKVPTPSPKNYLKSGVIAEKFVINLEEDLKNSLLGEKDHCSLWNKDK